MGHTHTIASSQRSMNASDKQSLHVSSYSSFTINLQYCVLYTLSSLSLSFFYISIVLFSPSPILVPPPYIRPYMSPLLPTPTSTSVRQRYTRNINQRTQETSETRFTTTAPKACHNTAKSHLIYSAGLTEGSVSSTQALHLIHKTNLVLCFGIIMLDLI